MDQNAFNKKLGGKRALGSDEVALWHAESWNEGASKRKHSGGEAQEVVVVWVEMEICWEVPEALEAGEINEAEGEEGRGQQRVNSV